MDYVRIVSFLWIMYDLRIFYGLYMIYEILNGLKVRKKLKYNSLCAFRMVLN